MVVAKQLRPIIRRLQEPIIAGKHAAAAAAVDDLGATPTSPLERDSQLIKRWKNRDSDGVGLGILAALDDAGNKTHRQLNASAPIAVGSPRVTRLGWRHEAAQPPASLAGETTSDFLSCCHLCRKRLHGKDIYMYRGEKAFCSNECRYRQMVSDECMEKCRSDSSEVSCSPCSGGRLFFTSVTAA